MDERGNLIESIGSIEDIQVVHQSNELNQSFEDVSNLPNYKSIYFI